MRILLAFWFLVFAAQGVTAPIPVAPDLFGVAAADTGMRLQGPPLKLGFAGLAADDFLPFQNFRYEGDPSMQADTLGVRTVASLGMVHWTHRYNLARREAAEGDEPLPPLARYDEARSRRFSVIDSLNRRVSFRFAEEPGQFQEQLVRRLEGLETRKLSFALRSMNHRRERHIFIYSATRDVAGVWTCRFFDPHLPKESPLRLNGELRFDPGYLGYAGEADAAALGEADAAALGEASPFTVSKAWAAAANPPSELPWAVADRLPRRARYETDAFTEPIHEASPEFVPLYLEQVELAYRHAKSQVRRLTRLAARAKQAVQVAYRVAETFEEAMAASGDAERPEVEREVIEQSCFVGGTEVLTSRGRRPIEEIQVGDLVFAKRPVADADGPASGLRWARVTHTTRRLVHETYRVGLAGAGVLEGTGEHPVWVSKERGFVPLGELKGGDVILGPGGSRSEVLQVTEKRGKVWVHNLTVEKVHTYFVALGDAMVLVHNADCGDSGNALGKRREQQVADELGGSVSNRKVTAETRLGKESIEVDVEGADGGFVQVGGSSKSPSQMGNQLSRQGRIADALDVPSGVAIERGTRAPSINAAINQMRKGNIDSIFFFDDQ